MSKKAFENKKREQLFYHVRSAAISDLDVICEIEQICSSTPWQSDSLRQDLSSHDKAHYWVAEFEQPSRVVAYGAYWHMVDEAEIMNIAVLPEWRRKGIARHLLRTMEAHARQLGLKALFLEVRESNSAARQLYRDSGFTEIACRHQYYPNNRENAIIMSKNLVKNMDDMVISDNKTQ